MLEAEQGRLAARRHELEEGRALAHVEVLLQDVPQPDKMGRFDIVNFMVTLKEGYSLAEI